MAEKIQIFLSSTIDDLKDYRETLANAINDRPGWEAIRAELLSATTASSRYVCLREARTCPIYIGIFKNRYGFIPKENNPEGHCVTVLEYYEAKRSENSILLYVQKDAQDVEPALKAFLKKAMDFDTGHFVRFFNDINELVRFVLMDVDNEIRNGFMNVKRKQRNGRDIYSLGYFKRVQERF